MSNIKPNIRYSAKSLFVAFYPPTTAILFCNRLKTEPTPVHAQAAGHHARDAVDPRGLVGGGVRRVRATERDAAPRRVVRRPLSVVHERRAYQAAARRHGRYVYCRVSIPEYIYMETLSIVLRPVYS